MSAISFTTDLAALAAFDPDVLRHRVRADRGWWREGDLLELPELDQRRCAIWPIGREGSFRCALRVGELEPGEAARATGKVSGLGLKVESGRVFVGAAERLPGGGFGERISHIPDTGAVVEVEPGDYAAEVHVIHWRDDDACYDEDGEVIADAPADFVVLLRGIDQAGFHPPEIPDLLDLLPRAEAKGKAKVRAVPRRRRSEPAPARGRRRSASTGGGGGSPPRAPRRAPTEVAPYEPEQVRDAFREVLHGTTLHPPDQVGLRAVGFQPRERRLQPHEIDLPLLCKKVTRVREQLRMLEAKINGNKKLDLGEKVALQGPITAVYQAAEGLLEGLADEAERAGVGEG